MTLNEVANFFDCECEDIEYYIKIGGSDPRNFIIDTHIGEKELLVATEQAEKIISMAENASCLENQSPSASILELSKKILIWEIISGAKK